MIQPIDIDENVGNSLKKINDNIIELETLVCNLQKRNIAWHDAVDVWNDHEASWSSMSTTINELSSKWNDMANIVYSLSSYWNGTITFIYPHPFVEGTQNVTDIKDFLINNHPPDSYNIDQDVTVYFFIQNYDSDPIPENNIFQKTVSSICLQNSGTSWEIVECGRKENCHIDNCDDLFQSINVNSQYSCMAKSQILYYLINTD